MVFRICRVIDAFVCRINDLQLRIQAEEILKLENAPHSRGGQVLENDRPAQLWCADLGGRTCSAELLVIEPLGGSGVLLPPTTKGAHVMGRGGHHTKIG